MKTLRFMLALAATALAAAACTSATTPGPTTPEPATQDVVRVPRDVPTIAKAVERVRPGGLVLVADGTYHESVTIVKKGVTLRGMDRNGVVLDGDGRLSNGVVAGAEGVTVQNLTVRRYLLNGVLVTGVVDDKGVGIGRGSDGYQRLDTSKFPPLPGFKVDYVTALDNGLYGIYAFNRHAGTISNSYVAGSADSGIYVGQCEDCDITVVGNVAEYNAVGMENANASGVTIAGNRFTDNRVGLTLLSEYQEAYVPQRRSVAVGNLVSDNNQAGTPEQAEGGFGVGIGLSGTDGVELLRNRVERNSSGGVLVAPVEDIPSTGNRAEGNVLAHNRVDLAYWSSAQSGGPRHNCLHVPAGAVTYPRVFPSGLRCAAGGPLPATAPYELQPAPDGIPFLDVPLPGPLPTMPGDPASMPHAAAMSSQPVTVAAVPVPPADLLADQVRPHR
jgi:hypothetical protein